MRLFQFYYIIQSRYFFAAAFGWAVLAMKGAFARCKFCGGEELKVNRANETIQCESCDHILEERYNDYRVTPIFIERDFPFYVVTDDALSKHKYIFQKYFSLLINERTAESNIHVCSQI